jgi:hypothetical protein
MILLHEYHFVTVGMNKFSAEPDQRNGIALQNWAFVRNNSNSQCETHSESEGNGTAIMRANQTESGIFINHTDSHPDRDVLAIHISEKMAHLI